MEETTSNQISEQTSGQPGGRASSQPIGSPTGQPRRASLGPVSAAMLRHRSGGQAIVILALFMMFLLGVVGTVYDIGFARHEASRAQRAADAAALAGVVFMPEHFFSNNTQANATDAATFTGQRHGYLQTQIFPKKIPRNGSELQVDITSVYTTAFLGLFGFSTLPIHVTAIAQYNTPITMGSPDPFLGVGNALAVANAHDPSVTNENFWLSLESPGTPKQNGDAFAAKWDNLANINPGGPFQPDHDFSGYNFGLYTPDGTTANLLVYDAAYQPKVNRTFPQQFSQADPCAVEGQPPLSCHTGNGDRPDFNDIGSRWCSSNTIDTGDNQAGGGQCDLQAANITTVYTLYQPDSTPWYFDDDVVANNGIWTVPASPLTGTVPNGTPQGAPVPSYVYSDTWTNFGGNGAYTIYPISGNHQWRLQVNNPVDNNSNTNGTIGQNEYAIHLATSFQGVQVYAIQRLPVYANVRAGTSDFYLADVPIADAGKTLVVSLFDAGDAQLGTTNYMQLLGPLGNGFTPVYFDAYVHDYQVPPGPDTVYNNVSQLNTTRPTYDTNDRWVDVVYKLPPTFPGGFFKIQYVFQGQTFDRTVWRISIRGNPVHIVLGGS